MDNERRESCGCIYRLVVDITSGERREDHVHVCREHARKRARTHLAQAREVLAQAGGRS